MSGRCVELCYARSVLKGRGDILVDVPSAFSYRPLWSKSRNGIWSENAAADGSYTWVFPGGKSLEDITVTLSMKEPGGYHSQYLIHQLTRTDNRADYSSDAVFANFRSSSPVNNDLGRAAYADVPAKASGIQTVMNLVDSDALIERHIAQKLYGTSIRDPNQIQIGQILTVPAVWAVSRTCKGRPPFRRSPF